MSDKINIKNYFGFNTIGLLALYILFLLVALFANCKKLAEVDPTFTSTNAGLVYTDNVTAAAVLTGIYTRLSDQSPFSGESSISLYTGLSSDELTLFNQVTDFKLNAYYQNALTGNAASSLGSDFWSPFFSYIFTCNSAIEGLNASTTLTPSVKQQLLGEAKFLRGYFYFYLVNLFGDVPLAITTDHKVNSLLPKSAKEDVFNQIVTDLEESKSLLSNDYMDGTLRKYSNINTAERLRPTKWAAMALLARVHLYKGDYLNAETEATAVINNNNFFNLTALDDVFLKNSRESIWQLQPINSGQNTLDGLTFILPSTGPDNSQYRVFLSDQLLKSFENGDQRRYNKHWIDSVVVSTNTFYYPFKYKVGYSNIISVSDLTEYQMILRLAEQYLIRAEARARLANLSGSVEDLNSIRSRAGLTAYGGPASQAPVLSAILHERQVELFTELGHRWLDLKRTENVNSTMNNVTPVKSNGSNWKSYQQFYPLPWTEIQKGLNLTQNPGY